MASSIHRLKHGQSAQFEGPAGNHTVSYYEHPSMGDNGSPVHGATTGEYTVTGPDGRSKDFEHGPHANTITAARRGANPNAKGYAADQAGKSIMDSHVRAQRQGGMFNDRRG